MNQKIENAIAAIADVKTSVAAIIKDGGDPIVTFETVGQMQKLVELYELCRWTAEYFRQDVDAFKAEMDDE